MKPCPFCAEQIQDEAVKCRYCNEFIGPQASKTRNPWYYSSTSLVVAFLTVGPLMLPLVWLKPGLSRQARIAITAVIMVLTLGVVIAMQWGIGKITSYYQLAY